MPVSPRATRSLGVHVLSVLFLFSLPVFGEASATVSFTLDFPGSDPAHYVITASSSGQATYDSNGKISADAQDSPPFHTEFTLAPATEEKIFDLAKHAHYFEGKVDSGRKNIASTGVKTLSYKDGERTSQASYNYSPNSSVQQLTALFQNLSATLEFGKRLTYYHQYQKLALHDELKRMEQMAEDNSLEDIGAIAPILRNIATDNTVINVDRARAERLLVRSGAQQTQ